MGEGTSGGAGAPRSLRLTYFDFEGTAEKVRLALALGGIDFEDERVPWEEWPEMKLKSRVGNLPTLQIAGHKRPVTEVGAMLRYVGQIAGLYPPSKLLQIEEVIGLEEEIDRMLSPSNRIVSKPEHFGYPADLPADLRWKIQRALRNRLTAEGGDLQRMLSCLESYLEDGSPFMCGDRITIADCQVIPLLRQLKSGTLDGVPVGLLDRFPRLKRYYSRFHELPEVKEHYDL